MFYRTCVYIYKLLLRAILTCNSNDIFSCCCHSYLPVCAGCLVFKKELFGQNHQQWQLSMDYLALWYIANQRYAWWELSQLSQLSHDQNSWWLKQMQTSIANDRFIARSKSLNKTTIDYQTSDDNSIAKWSSALKFLKSLFNSMITMILVLGCKQWNSVKITLFPKLVG